MDSRDDGEIGVSDEFDEDDVVNQDDVTDQDVVINQETDVLTVQEITQEMVEAVE